MAEHRVTLSRFLQPRGREIDGPGICGLTQPFMVGALAGDRVQLDAVATLDCPMIAALDEWIDRVVQPAAQARFGQPIAQIDTMGSYSCRGINGQAGAHVSEHAFGNAIDIAGFRLADGRRLTVVHDWTRGDEQAQAFLRDVHAGACDSFTTVLGPGYNALHYNHIHVDLAMHGRTATGPRRVCKPVPDAHRPSPPRLDTLPDAPNVEEEQDVAAVASEDGSTGGVVASAPPAVDRRAPMPGNRYAGQATRGAAGAPNDWDVTSSIPRR